MNILRLIPLEERIVLDATIFVDITSTYNQSASDVGTTWLKAYNNLEGALAQARTDGHTGVDQIWVADGVYKPTAASADPTITNLPTFLVPDRTALYGGFVGGEMYLSDRVFGGPKTGSNGLTILSGDLGVQGDLSDNSQHVVTIDHATAGVTLDGFTIRDGNAAFTSTTLNKRQSGGGVWTNSSDVTLTNVTFTHNQALGTFVGSTPVALTGLGAGLSAIRYTTTDIIGHLDLQNVVFDSNFVNRFGGGFYSNQGGTVRISDSLFQNNVALCPIPGTGNVTGQGGGFQVSQITGGISPTQVDMYNTTIQNNSALDVGGVRGFGGGLITFGLVNLNIYGSEILHNTAVGGGGLYFERTTDSGIVHAPTTHIYDTIIKDNIAQFTAGIATGAAQSSGGGLLNAGTIWIERSIIQNNLARSTGGDSTFAGGGGGIKSQFGSFTLIDSFVTGNTAVLGGGIYRTSATEPGLILRSVISNNTSQSVGGTQIVAGGGIATNAPGTLTIQDSTIDNNRTYGTGGGIGLFGILTLSNTHVENNVAQSADGLIGSGGGIYLGRGPTTNTISLTVNDSFLNMNVAAQFGGALFADIATTTTLSNTEIHQNSANLDGGGVYFLGGLIGLTPATTTATLTNVHFNQNSAGRDGGSLYAFAAPGIVSLTVSDSHFLNGVAGRNGGSIDLVNLTGASLATITNNHFNHNDASNNGGGIAIFNSNANLTHNKFANNDADVLGDDIYITANSGTVNGQILPSQILDALLTDNHFGNVNANDIAFS